MTALGKKETKSNIFSALLLGLLQEAQTVADKELAADDKEQDNAGEDIAEGMVQAVDGGNLAGTPAEKHQQQAGEHHHQGIELGQPGNHNRGEAPTTGNGGGDGMVGAAHEQKPREAAQAAGNHHGAHDDLAHVDAHIPGGALTFAHHGNLVALLGALQVEIHHEGQRGYDQNVQQVLVGADLRQPAGLGVLIDDADFARALGHFPEDDEIGNQLSRHIVHHQGEQSLIGVPLGLADGGNAAPDSTGHNAGNHHQHNEQPVGNLVSQQNHAGRGGKAAGQNLAFAANVPEAHLEGGSHRQRHAQKNCQVLTQNPGLPLGAEGTGEHGFVHADGVFAGQSGGHHGADDQRQHNGGCPNAPGLIPVKGRPLGDMQNRPPILFTHWLFLPNESSSCPLRAWRLHDLPQCR